MFIVREDEILVIYWGFNEWNDLFLLYILGVKIYKFFNMLVIIIFVFYIFFKLFGLFKIWNLVLMFLYYKIVIRVMVESGLWNRSGDVKEGKIWSGGEEVVVWVMVIEVFSWGNLW